MSFEQKQALLEYYRAMLSSERQERFKQVISQRTKRVVIVLEDIFQPNNMSAVLRSCDCFGIQDVYVVEKRNSFKACDSIARGAGNWLTLHFYKDIGSCYGKLKELGYTIVATTPHAPEMVISQVSVDQPIALAFGNEETGLSSYALEQADIRAKIAMYGFIESFNISVTAALCLYEVVKNVRAANLQWQLPLSDSIDIQLDWLIKTTPYTNVIKEALRNISTK